MRLIDADALKEEFEKNTDRKGYIIGDPEVIIDNAPTIECDKKSLDYDYGFAEGCRRTRERTQRPRGHWQVLGYHIDKYFYCKCSNCQKKTKVFYDKTNPGEFGSLADIRRNVNFCMFCGADMREDEE